MFLYNILRSPHHNINCLENINVMFELNVCCPLDCKDKDKAPYELIFYLFFSGISAETHLLLEHVFCGHDLHGSASPSLHEETTLLLLTLPCLALLLLSCVWAAWARCRSSWPSGCKSRTTAGHFNIAGVMSCDIVAEISAGSGSSRSEWLVSGPDWMSRPFHNLREPKHLWEITWSRRVGACWGWCVVTEAELQQLKPLSLISLFPLCLWGQGIF